MSNISVKRINRDVSLIYKEPLDSLGIYIDWNCNNIKNVKALIIGPEDTPYRYGYYFFNIIFPNEYPHAPPKVSYETRFNKIRFNPNLYTCGKVCISILNTWSGPQWTSCQSLKSILLSLQSILNENPLQNEPGFENAIDNRHKTYNSVIEHENINISIIRMINNTPHGFEAFKPIIRKTFLRNYSKISNYTNNLITKYSSKDYLQSQIYSMKIKNKYSSFFKQLKILNSNLLGKEIIIDLKEIKEEVKKEIIKIKKKKRVPNTPAKSFDLGIIQKSENNNKMYIVSENKNGIKRWKKFENNKQVKITI